ncbi:MAG: hypothetical protein ABEH56_08875 [Salinirussus sp.]
MGVASLLAKPLLDDDEDVRTVQQFAAAGARTGASLGSRGGPVGAGVGAGMGSAVGYLVGYGAVGVDPADRLGSEDGAGHRHGDHAAGPASVDIPVTEDGEG